MENKELELQIAKELTLKFIEVYHQCPVGSSGDKIFELPTKYGEVFQTFFKSVVATKDLTK
jgi:hypothetical protein